MVQTPAQSLTLEEFLALPDDNTALELVDGVTVAIRFSVVDVLIEAGLPIQPQQ